MKKIQVISGWPASGELLKEVFADEGYETSLIRVDGDVSDLFLDLQADLFVLDHIPALTFQRIRGTRKGMNTPLVIITKSFSEYTLIKDLYLTHVTPFTMPFDLDQLCDAISHALAERQWPLSWQ